MTGSPQTVGKTFFRTTNRRLPALADFIPYGKLGRTLKRPASQKILDQWHNDVSMFDTMAAAQANAAKYGLPSFLAEVFVPDGGAVSWRQTGPNANHFSLRGPAESMLANARPVVTR